MKIGMFPYMPSYLIWFRGFYRTTGFGMDKPGAVVIKKKNTKKT